MIAADLIATSSVKPGPNPTWSLKISFLGAMVAQAKVKIFFTNIILPNQAKSWKWVNQHDFKWMYILHTYLMKVHIVSFNLGFNLGSKIFQNPKFTFCLSMDKEIPKQLYSVGHKWDIFRTLKDTVYITQFKPWTLLYYCLYLSEWWCICFWDQYPIRWGTSQCICLDRRQTFPRQGFPCCRQINASF